MLIEKIKNYLRDTDYYILMPALLLCGIGILSIYSSTQSLDYEKQFNVNKQWLFFGAGIVLIIVITLIPIRLIDSGSLWLYAISLVLLLILLMHGSVRYGAQRWFALGPFSLQPSELAKIATVLFISRILALQRVAPASVINIVLGWGLAAIPMGLIIKQPDLGTALTIGALPLPILYRHGISLFSIFAMFSPFATAIIYIGSGYDFYVFITTLLAVAVILFFSRRPNKIIAAVFIVNVIFGLGSEPLWDSLKDYQKERILTFLEPERDAQGAGYQILQSQIAIGNGGITGQGLFQGSQTQLKFLPEQYTDFVFTVIGEEWGFIGALVVLFLYGILIYRILLLSDAIDDKFCNLVLVGIGTLITFQVFVNIGMTIGLMPVTGIPLPFISYGGTALLTNLSLIGIVLNISMRKKVYDIH